METRPRRIPKDFEGLMEYARIGKMCITPSCTTCGAMPFRRFCRRVIGYEGICEMVRAVTPEYFGEHYTLEWMQAATALDIEFQREGGLPRDNWMLQRLEALSAAHEAARRAGKGSR